MSYKIDLQGAMPVLHHERMNAISSRLPALVLDYVPVSQRPQNLCLLRKSLAELKRCQFVGYKFRTIKINKKHLNTIMDFNRRPGILHDDG